MFEKLQQALPMPTNLPMRYNTSMIKLPGNIQDFMHIFLKKGFQVFVVGGAVRDLITGKKTDDWDFATDATPDTILTFFSKAFYNNTYGTVTVVVDDLLFEVTPFRKESLYKDRRHPGKIEWAKTIEEDLARRDFTINAMAFDGKTLIDPYDGKKHLQNKIVMAVGDPDKRFAEDSLRLMRAIRLASQLGFLIEEKTRMSIQKNASLIVHISWERIRDELLKIISSNNPSDGILFLQNTGLLKYIIPELDACFTVPQKSPKRHHIYDVGTHSVMSLKNCPSSDPITRLAALLHDIGKVQTYHKDEHTKLITFHNHEVVGTKLVGNIADRLRLSNKQKEKLVRLVKYHQFTVSEVITDRAVRRFIREVGKEYLQDMFDLRTADRIGSGATPTSWRYELFKKRIEEVQHEPFKVTDLKIDGTDVMSILNIKPSRKVGDILKKLFNEVVEGRVKNERKYLLEEIKKLADS